MSGDFESQLVATSPGFIQRYFETSRLHHLSAWKSDLSEYALEKMTAKANAGLMECGRASDPTDKYRTIMHIDMDCFFASVGVRDKPHLKDKPVAVAHSVRGTSMDFSSSEIASCNYIARSKGVKNGAYIGSAKKLCPDLVIVPYEFAKYDEVSRLLYDILIIHADFVQAVSCDEAFIDITQYMMKKLRQGQVPTAQCNDVIETLSITLAQQIRQDIHRATGCTASVGISSNILLARMATKKAKPNGVHFIHQHQASSVLSELPIRDLPGIGHSLENKCKELSLATCGDLSAVSEAQLQLKFGGKTGTTLRNFALGIDERKLENKPRQSVSCEINWGMRFETNEQIDTFLRDLSKEVYSRLEKGLQSANHVSISAKKKLYQGEPQKFLGCGHCEDFSRSMALNQAISSYEALVEVVLRLYKEIGLVPTDVRGIGIHLKGLKSNSGSGGGGAGGGVVGSAAGIQSFFKSGEGGEAGVGHNALLDSVLLNNVEEEGEEEEEDCVRELLSISGGRPNHLSIKGGRNNNNSTMAKSTSSSDVTREKRKQATINFQPAAPPAVACDELESVNRSSSVGGVKSTVSPSTSSSSSGSSKVTASSYWHHPPVVIKPKPPVGSFFEARPANGGKNKSGSVGSSKTTTFVLDGGEENGATAASGGITEKLTIDEEVYNALPPDIQREYAHYQIVRSNSSGSSGSTVTSTDVEDDSEDVEYRWEGVSVDLEVLNSLPEHIRREYIQDMKRQRVSNGASVS